MRIQAIKFSRYFYWKPIVTFLFLLLVWQLVASFYSYSLTFFWNLFNWEPPVPDWSFLSSPINLIKELPSELKKGELLANAGRTSLHTAIAFTVSLILSIFLSVILFIFRNVREGLEPLMKAMSGVPPVTLLPIFALALGLDSPSIIALGIFGATLSISLILLDIFNTLNPDLSKMLKNLGYSSLGSWLWKFSYISENLYLAAREGLRWSLILVVVAEMQIGDVSKGIGYYINSARLNQSYELVYLGIIACGGVALILQLSLITAAKMTHYLIKKMLLRA